MPANSRWDLIRALKGWYAFQLRLPLDPFISGVFENTFVLLLLSAGDYNADTYRWYSHDAATDRTSGWVILGVCRRCCLDHQMKWALGLFQQFAQFVREIQRTERETQNHTDNRIAILQIVWSFTWLLVRVMSGSCRAVCEDAASCWPVGVLQLLSVSSCPHMNRLILNCYTTKMEAENCMETFVTLPVCTAQRPTRLEFSSISFHNVLSTFKPEIHINNVWRSSPYRAVNTPFRL